MNLRILINYLDKKGVNNGFRFIKRSNRTNVYHIPSDKIVPHHRHEDRDEVFYCIRGNGFGILENTEIEINVGDVFTAPAGLMHALRSDRDLYVISFLVPVINNKM